MLGFVLQQVEKYMHLFAPFGDLSKLILKVRSDVKYVMGARN